MLAAVAVAAAAGGVASGGRLWCGAYTWPAGVFDLEGGHRRADVAAAERCNEGETRHRQRLVKWVGGGGGSGCIASGVCIADGAADRCERWCVAPQPGGAVPCPLHGVWGMQAASRRTSCVTCGERRWPASLSWCCFTTAGRCGCWCWCWCGSQHPGRAWIPTGTLATTTAHSKTDLTDTPAPAIARTSTCSICTPPLPTARYVSRSNTFSKVNFSGHD